MSFEPNTICPITSEIRAQRVLKRIAAREAFADALASRIMALDGSDETKAIVGHDGASSKGKAENTLALSRTRKPMATGPKVADVAPNGGTGIGQNTRRRRVGA
jgi:hypothetical protein